MRFIAVTKYAGLKGTVELTKTDREELEKRFNPVFLDGLSAIGDMVDTGKELEILKASGEKSGCAVYEGGEGGILKTLWDITQAEKCGMETDLRKIPVRQETIEVCDIYDVDPYKADAGGMVVFTADAGCAADIISELQKAGIPANIIGRLTDSRDKILLNKGTVRYLDRPC